MSKRIVVGVSDLETTHPELYAELTDPSSVPDTISFGSNIPVDWTCQLGHVWSARPNDRSRGKGCPFCTGRLVLPGFNDIGTVAPNIADRLYDQKLRESFQISSNKSTSWLCGIGHRFEARVADMVKSGSFKGCPYCSGKMILKGFNDLATTHPELAQELCDPAHKSTEVSSMSNKKVLWVCAKNHEWVAAVCDRTSGNGCKLCSISNTSKIEQTLFNKIQDVFPELLMKNGGLINVSWEGRSRIYPDILVVAGNHKVVIEYDGEYWHRDKIDRDTYSTVKLLEEGYWVIRVRESCHGRVLPYLDIVHEKLLQVSHDLDSTPIESTIHTITNKISSIKDHSKSYKETV